MKFSFLISVISFTLISTSVIASKKHPDTGELLADVQTFTYNIGSEPPSIDPQLSEDVTGNEIIRDLFEGLLTQKEDGSLAPGVAERWESNASRDVYTFFLRNNARWSNGDPVTAYDFEYAWKRSVDPELASPQADYMAIMAVKNAAAIKKGEKQPEELAVRALDNYTFRVELGAPIPYFTSMLIAATTMPAPRKTIEEFGNNWTKPGNMVSNGAYILKQHVLNERLVRVRNPMYWNNDRTIIDQVIALLIHDDSQAYNRYLSDELDITNIPTGQFKRLKKERPEETHSNPLLCSYYYYFNVEKAPLNDIRVRQALSYAIDRNIITESVLGSGQIPAYTLTPGETANFNLPNLAYAKMTQSERVKQARKLLIDAGYDTTNPLQISILYNTSEGHKKIAIAISQMWKQKLGINVTLKNQEWKTFLTTRKQGNFEIARSGWCGYYNEPSAFLNMIKSDSEYNDSNYINLRVDKLMDEAKTMENPNLNYTQVEQIIGTEFPIVPIYHYTTVKLLKPYIKGWPFQNIQNIWYSKNLYVIAH